MGGLAYTFMIVMIFILTFIAFALFIRISQVDHQIQEDAGTMTALKIATEKKIENYTDVIDYLDHADQLLEE